MMAQLGMIDVHNISWRVYVVIDENQTWKTVCEQARDLTHRKRALKA
jgi:hypothetical protein